MTIEELYDAYYDELLYWCEGMCGDESTAEDMVQEGFARAIMNSDRFLYMHDIQQRAWLYRTIKNMYLDRIRHSAFEIVDDDISETANIDDDYDMSEISQLLGTLPGIDGVLFNMRYLQGYTSTELGRIFNLPAGTVRSKLSSARRRLKKMLKE